MSELKLDFDKKRQMVLKRIRWIVAKFRLNVQAVKVCRTRKGFHIRIFVKEVMHPITVTLVQTLMGSDYKREAYNAIRAYNLSKKRGAILQNWNVLYYKKIIRGKVVSVEKFDEALTGRLKRCLGLC